MAQTVRPATTSSNRSRSERRNLTKGEMAMALAMLLPDPEKGGRGNKTKALETSGFSRQRLGQARAVLRYSVELAEAVRDGEPCDRCQWAGQ